MPKIIGGTTATSMRIPDWNQKNPNRADYIKNKPDVANALKGKEEGYAVSLKDVSPVEHEIKVKLARTDATAPYYKYDFNGDGKVDEEDKIELSYHVNFPSNYPLPWWTNGDVNGDGKIDTDDISAFGDMLESGDESLFEKVNVFEGVTLTKRGKNVFEFPYDAKTGTQKQMEFTVNEDMTITASGTAGGYTAFFNVTKNNIFKHGVTYVFKKIDHPDFAYGMEAIDKTTGSRVSVNASQPFTWDAKRYDVAVVYITNVRTGTWENVVFKPLCEIGTIATEWEPPKAPETVPVNADGTAIVVGKGESITLSTDAEDVTISADYNRDLNKAIADILAKIGG